jgi:hypothetical protein
VTETLVFTVFDFICFFFVFLVKFSILILLFDWFRYKCNDFGAWLRGYNMELTWPVLIDNDIRSTHACTHARATYARQMPDTCHTRNTQSTIRTKQ